MYYDHILYTYYSIALLVSWHSLKPGLDPGLWTLDSGLQSNKILKKIIKMKNKKNKINLTKTKKMKTEFLPRVT